MPFTSSHTEILPQQTTHYSNRSINAHKFYDPFYYRNMQMDINIITK